VRILFIGSAVLVDGTLTRSLKNVIFKKAKKHAELYYMHKESKWFEVGKRKDKQLKDTSFLLQKSMESTKI